MPCTSTTATRRWIGHRLLYSALPCWVFPGALLHWNQMPTSRDSCAPDFHACSPYCACSFALATAPVWGRHNGVKLRLYSVALLLCYRAASPTCTVLHECMAGSDTMSTGCHRHTARAVACENGVKSNQKASPTKTCLRAVFSGFGFARLNALLDAVPVYRSLFC